MLPYSLVATGVFVAIAIGLTNAGVAYSQNSSTVLEQAQKSLQTKENEIIGKFESYNFQATNLTLIDKGYGMYEIIGFLQNMGNDRYGSVSLVVTLFDKNNRLIGIDEAVPIMEADVMEPKGMSPFKIPILNDVTNLHHYLIEVTVTDPL